MGVINAAATWAAIAWLFSALKGLVIWLGTRAAVLKILIICLLIQGAIMGGQELIQWAMNKWMPQLTAMKATYSAMGDGMVGGGYGILMSINYFVPVSETIVVLSNLIVLLGLSISVRSVSSIRKLILG